MTIKTYDFENDCMKEVDQNDFDDIQIALNKLGNKDVLIKFIANLNSVKDCDLIKELESLLTPYLYPEIEFTSYSSFSKTWIKNNPDKIAKIEEWRKSNPDK